MLALAVMVAAAAQLSFAAQAPSARARDLYDRAVELDRQGNASAALSLLWEAAGLAPGDATIQDRLGAALERVGALDAAVDAYRAAAAATLPAPGAAHHLVLALVKAGHAPEAIARARRRTVEAPRDADGWFTLGLAQADVDVDGAIDSFQRALTIDPRHALARYNLALVLLHADRLQPALDALHHTISSQPTPDAQYTLGIAYWRLGDLDRAATSLAGAVRTRPDYADAHLALGSVLQARGDVLGSVAALRHAITLRPDLPAPHVVLAQTLARSGDQAGAARESAAADRLGRLSQQSQAAATLTAAGSEKLDANDAPAAADCFRRAIEAFEPFAPAHYQLGRALDRLGQRDAARAAFARAQQLNPALVPPR
jgi:superkiller protein 3